MADNNLVLTIVLVVAVALLLSGNLTGYPVRDNAPGFSSRESFGVPAGSQIRVCYSEYFGKEIASNDYYSRAIPGGYRIEVCDDVGNLRTIFCQDPPTAAGVSKIIRTDPTSVGCRDLAISNTISPESTL